MSHLADHTMQLIQDRLADEMKLVNGLRRLVEFARDKGPEYIMAIHDVGVLLNHIQDERLKRSNEREHAQDARLVDGGHAAA